MKRSLSANEEWPKEIVEEEHMDVIKIDNEKFLLFDFNGRYYSERNIFMKKRGVV